MRITLPKNRIAPLIIFASICVIISLVLGTYQVNRLYQYSYREKLQTDDSMTQNVVTLLKQEIQSTYQTLLDCADLAAKSGGLNKQNIKTLLSLLSENKSYLELEIAGTDGKGYNSKGEIIDISGEKYFKNANYGKVNASDKIEWSEDELPTVTVAAPIYNNGKYKGILAAKISAQISNLKSFQSELEEGSRIYIINSNNQPVFYLQDSNISKFNYDKMIADGYERYEAEKHIPRMSLKDLFISGRNTNTKYIWDKRKLGINDWYVLVGRENTISSVTRDIIRLSNIMWVFISLIMFILFILMITIQRRSKQKVIKMLYLDPVTGGYNWYKFRILGNKLLAGKQSGKSSYALVNFDINRFKTINDVYGFQKGDEVLKEIYQVIKNWVKPGEPFTRYAADQFYILMNINSEEEVPDRIEKLNKNLHQLYYTTAARISFGVYYITEQLDSIDRMGEFASIAKKNNKSSAEGIISYFDDAARKMLLEEEKIENTMNDALQRNEFKVFLQPKYTATGERMSGAEALVRWYTSNGDVISPGYFIPVFEKNGFITRLDYYMLKNVCALLKGWLDKGFHPVPISVNISRLHFANPSLADIICGIVDDYKVPHSLIELELTESAFLQNKQMLIETVIALQSFGFLVSMDDFGAGYSSLNSLKDLPLDVVKLDGELFRMTNEIERGRTVIRNTITMAKDLNMKVVAECIETKEQVDYLCGIGCDIIQGYYYAKPMPADQFEERYLVESID